MMSSKVSLEKEKRAYNLRNNAEKLNVLKSTLGF